MLKRCLPAILFSLVLIGKIHAQEVIVAREKKSELRRHTPQPSEQLPSESTTPTPHKSKPREKKSAPPTLTLEEMRAAGARAAEGPKERSVSQSTKTREPELETAPMPNPAVPETHRPVKRETPVEQRSSSRSAKSGGTNIDGVGP